MLISHTVPVTVLSAHEGMIRQCLLAGYEPSTFEEGAVFIEGGWWLPKFGGDSIQVVTKAIEARFLAAQQLAQMYFEIAAEAIGEEEVRRRLDLRLAGQCPDLGTLWITSVILRKSTMSGDTTTQTLSWRFGCSEDEARGAAVKFAMEVKLGFSVEMVTVAAVTGLRLNTPSPVSADPNSP